MIWDTIAGPLISIINKVIPDKAQAAAAVSALNQMQAAGALEVEKQQLLSITSAQSDIDKVEAGSSKLFVAGWRPMIGWVCATALAAQYIVKPLIGWGFSVSGHTIPILPGLDDNLWQLMFGMLGMGALRSFDKVKGVASK